MQNIELIKQIASTYAKRYRVPYDELEGYLVEKYQYAILPKLNQADTQIAFIRKSLQKYCINFLRDKSRMLRITRVDHDIVQGYETLLKHRPYLAKLPIEHATSLLGITPEQFAIAKQRMAEASTLELKAYAKTASYEVSEASAYIANKMCLRNRELLEAYYLDKQTIEQIADEYGMQAAEVKAIIDAETKLLAKLI